MEEQDTSKSLLRLMKNVDPVGELIPPLSATCNFLTRHHALRQGALREMASMTDRTRYLRASQEGIGGGAPMPNEGAYLRSLNDLVMNNMPSFESETPNPNH